MQLWTLLIQLLLVRYTIQKNIVAECNREVILPCDVDFSGNKYFSVTWYKGNKGGIIRKGLDDGKIRNYNSNITVSLDDKNGLVLPKVTPKDSGKYECSVSANVGGQNLNLFITLTVSECVTEPDVTTNAVTTDINTTRCTEGSQSAQDLPLMWSLIGYGAVGLTKIFLSIIIVWVFHIWTRRRRRW